MKKPEKKQIGLIALVILIAIVIGSLVLRTIPGKKRLYHLHYPADLCGYRKISKWKNFPVFRKGDDSDELKLSLCCIHQAHDER